MAWPLTRKITTGKDIEETFNRNENRTFSLLHSVSTASPFAEGSLTLERCCCCCRRCCRISLLPTNWTISLRKIFLRLDGEEEEDCDFVFASDEEPDEVEEEETLRGSSSMEEGDWGSDEEEESSPWKQTSKSLMMMTKGKTSNLPILQRGGFKIGMTRY